MSLSSKLRSRVLVQPEAQRAAAPKHRSIAFVELVTTAGLALSTAVAVTAVSIGIARADVLGAATKGDSAPFAIALFIGLLFAAMGALTAVMAPAPRRRD
jgi:glycerol uptake facilitator-like aquaporin